MPKTAADYRNQLAGILAKMRKQASAKPSVTTGTEVLQKFASLNEKSTKDEMEAAQNELVKLASTNPLFTVCRDRILMEKLASDVDALAAAEGISPEQAEAALGQAAEANPEMLDEAIDEANGEAVAELADAEAATANLVDGAQQLADNASAVLGQEVTADQILNAVDEVEAQAEELGVPPEALVQAAMEEMLGGEGAAVSPEDQANADAILEEAAANGVSPDEVLQMAAEELGEGEKAAEAPGEGEKTAEAPGEGEKTAEATGEGEKTAEGDVKPAQEKTASCNVSKVSNRVKFVQHLMHS